MADLRSAGSVLSDLFGAGLSQNARLITLATA